VGGRCVQGSPFPSVGRPPTSEFSDPLEIFREGLALARRAGMSWFDAYYPAEDAALSVAPERERDEWAEAIHDTRTAWMRAYERRPTGCSL
jgi:SRSO17 transposase